MSYDAIPGKSSLHFTNTQILCFADLQKLIRDGLERVNEAPLTGKSESRWSSYLAEEKDYMLPLPNPPGSVGESQGAAELPHCLSAQILLSSL